MIIYTCVCVCGTATVCLSIIYMYTSTHECFFLILSKICKKKKIKIKR